MKINYEKICYKLNETKIRQRTNLLLKVLNHIPESYLWTVDLVDNYFHRYPSKFNYDKLLFSASSICDDYATFDDNELKELFLYNGSVKDLQKYRYDLIKDLNMSFLRNTVHNYIIDNSENILLANYVCLCISLEYNMLFMNPNDWYSSVMIFITNYPNINSKFDQYILSLMHKYNYLSYVKKCFKDIIENIPESNIDTLDFNTEGVYLIKLDDIENIPLNRQNIINKISKIGGNGVVYCYEHNNKRVAMKKFKYKGLKILDLHEIIYLMRYKHKNVIDIIGYGMTYDNLYLFTEYMDSDLMDKTLTYNIKDCFQQILEAILYLHDNGIIHKDIKPSNIFFNKQTQCIKLIDFGLAIRHIKNMSYLSGISSSTIYIIPPDVLMGNEKYELGFDVWSCAITFIHILDKIPFFDDFINRNNEIYYIQKIFNVLGFPTEKEWKILTCFEKQNKFNQTPFIGFKNIETKYTDLLYKMLKYVEKDRCTAEYPLKYVRNFL